MFKINEDLPYNLTESHQSNPLRWTIVSVDGDTITPLAPVMKCKDYFNDVVAAKYEVFFEQYGFNNIVVPKQEGLDVLLTFVKFPETLKSKLSLVENPAHPVQVRVVDDESLLIYIPEYYFKNTYRISLLTYLIRLCNSTPLQLESCVDFISCLESTLATESLGPVSYTHLTLPTKRIV